MQDGRKKAAARPRRLLKIGLDVLMCLTLLYLLSYRPGQGAFRHGVIGCLFVLEVLAHQLLNLSWYRTLLKGRFNLKRALLTGAALLLILTVLVQLYVSYQLSGLCFDFMFLPGEPRKLALHAGLAAWLFVLTSLHLGLHLHNFLRRLERRAGPQLLKRAALYALETAAGAAGLMLLATSEILGQLAFRQQGHTGLTALEFMARHALMGLTLCLLVHLLLSRYERRSARSKPQRNKSAA